MYTKGKIVEIFKSLQGEGKYVGLPQIFVRLSMCNLQCTYCDTDFTNGDWMTYEEVLDRVQKLLQENPEVTSLSITGGEPLLQTEFLKVVLPRLKEQGMKVLLETNGTLPDGLRCVLSWIDIIAMDIKLASASLTAPSWSQHGAFLAMSQAMDTYVKVVVSAQTTDEDFERAVKLVMNIQPSTCFILQPVTPLGQASVPKDTQIERWIHTAREALTDVRVIPQMHKRWGIP